MPEIYRQAKQSRARGIRNSDGIRVPCQIGAFEYIRRGHTRAGENYRPSKSSVTTESAPSDTLGKGSLTEDKKGNVGPKRYRQI
ncbi:MAG: hypothetical protein ACLRW2_11220 [Parasutterella excrementihominis]